MLFGRSSASALLLLAGLPAAVLAGDVLSSNGFTNCGANADITVNNFNISFDRSTDVVDFDVSGSSASVQKVKASLVVKAYGKTVYTKDFNPCDASTKVDQLCPVPAGNFAAQGSQQIPAQYASMIPSIAFNVPDLDAQATIQLTSLEDNSQLACLQSNVGNGKTVQLPAVTYVAAGVAGAALLMTGASALASGGSVGAHASSPSFTEVFGWLQSMALNGMMSVQTPTIYRSFSKNFAFTTGLVPWTNLQTSIDNFRKSTGGNLTDNNVQYLQKATLIYSDGSNSTLSKRGIEFFWDGVIKRDGISTSVNGTGSADNSTTTSGNNGQVNHLVHGIQGYVEQLMIPSANTFMTVLLIFAIVVAAIVVSILLLKVILETWALFGSFPKKLTSFRKRYWRLLAKTITNLILVLYSIWVLYCIYQFTHGDSWAAKLLAGITLALFTGVLVFFTLRIWQLARKYKKSEGDASVLYEDKQIWMKYSIFYDNYKQQYWWLFVPVIIYSFAKGCVIAAGDGHGMAQTAGQLIIEALMLGLLLWTRPYETKASKWINIFIHVVRVLSVCCILVFVEELGISQTTQTVTGVVLIAIQSLLTGVLAILIAVNAIITCVKENPHRKRRKEAGKSICSSRTPDPKNILIPLLEKLNRDFDNLTPLDARNSLLLEPTDYKHTSAKSPLVATSEPMGYTHDPYGQYRDRSVDSHRGNSEDFMPLGHGDMGQHGHHAL